MFNKKNKGDKGMTTLDYVNWKISNWLKKHPEDKNLTSEELFLKHKRYAPIGGIGKLVKIKWYIERYGRDASTNLRSHYWYDWDKRLRKDKKEDYKPTYEKPKTTTYWSDKYFGTVKKLDNKENQ
jgi:hypothetical protein